MDFKTPEYISNEFCKMHKDAFKEFRKVAKYGFNEFQSCLSMDLKTFKEPEYKLDEIHKLSKHNFDRFQTMPRYDVDEFRNMHKYEFGGFPKCPSMNFTICEKRLDRDSRNSVNA